MTKLDTQRINRNLSGIAIGPALLDDHLLADAKQYKRTVASRYRLIKASDVLKLSAQSLYASVKLDGQLHFLYNDAHDCFLFNYNGRVITQLPLLTQAKAALGDRPTLLAGELYVHDAEQRTRVFQVSSALGERGDNAEALRFGVFDVLKLDHEPYVAKDFPEKIALMQQLAPAAGAFHSIEHWQVDKQQLLEKFNQWVTQDGEEGIVCVDSDAHFVYKLKPRHNIDVVVIGFTEMPDLPGSMRVLLTALMRPDHSLQVLGAIGSGFDDDARQAFLQQLKPLAVPSLYKETDRNHTAYTMVEPSVIIEVAFHDLITEGKHDKPQMKAVLTYEPSRGYEANAPERFVSILGGVFRRMRDDKAVNPTDLRLTQLAQFVDLDNLENASRVLDYAESVPLTREIYSKTSKGLVSVRKFITWKTNKDGVDDDYPAFVFCYVDYSPGRKDPLKRVVRIAATQSAIERISATFKKNEIKRGWSQVG